MFRSVLGRPQFMTYNWVRSQRTCLHHSVHPSLSSGVLQLSQLFAVCNILSYSLSGVLCEAGAQFWKLCMIFIRFFLSLSWDFYNSFVSQRDATSKDFLRKLISHFLNAFLGNCHSDCQLFSAQSIPPRTASDRGFPKWHHLPRILCFRKIPVMSP